MERRDLLKTVAAAAVAAISTAALAEEHDHQHHHEAAMKFAGLAASSGDCLQTGEVCMAHCLVLLSQGKRKWLRVPSRSMSYWRCARPCRSWRIRSRRTRPASPGWLRTSVPTARRSAVSTRKSTRNARRARIPVRRASRSARSSRLDCFDFKTSANAIGAF